MSWLFYKRGTILPYLSDVPLMGINKYRLHPLGIKHPRTFYINEGEKLYWAWEEDDLQLMWKRLLSLLESPEKAAAYFRKLDANIKLALNSSYRVKRLNLRHQSNKELLAIFEKLEKDITPAHLTMNSEIDIIDLYFEKYLRGKINSSLTGLSADELEEAYISLTKPVCHTYVNKQEIVVLRAAKHKDLSEKTIKNIYNNFWWTNLGWENVQPHSLSYFRSLVKKQIGRRTLTSSLAQAENFVAANCQERRKHLNRYRLGSEVKHWLNICDKYIFYHDRRKEVQVKTTYSFYLLLLEVARRFNLPVDDLVWLWHKEVKDILRGQSVDAREIAKRKKGIAALVYYNKFKVWSGKEAIRLRRQHVKEEKRRPAEIKGVGVNKKIIGGRVKVCAGFKEAKLKIKNGDILVCPMTTPDYVPSMKRAKAIITDEGGITCHAAIIARELKIPCVVGTKIATQVLSDGDLVKIDAGRGIIKIIR